MNLKRIKDSLKPSFEEFLNGLKTNNTASLQDHTFEIKDGCLIIDGVKQSEPSDFEQVLKDYLKKSNLMDIEDSVQSDNEQLAEYGVIDLHNPDLFDKGEWDDTYIVCKAKKDLHTNEWNPANPDDFVFSSDDPKEHPLYEGFIDQVPGVVNIKEGNYFLVAPQDGYVVDLGDTEDDAITMLHSI